MKISRKWLQKYFETELPETDVLSDALTFHAFEIEEHDQDLLDVKVLPDRACYALSHRGIAKELSAILSLPLKADPLTASLPSWQTTNLLSVSVDDSFVLRHTGALLRGVTVRPSPAWLSQALESIGQRSINNIVDATNYVMHDLGQPMHAFDVRTLEDEQGMVRITIRKAKTGETVTLLTGETVTLTDTMHVVSDAVKGTALDVAGIKGGAATSVMDATTDIFISVGNYDGTSVRKTAHALKVFTDASTRYQNRPSPELTAYGMRDLLTLVREVAGGEVVGVHDVYPQKEASRVVSISTETLNKKLGSSFTDADVENVFNRLSLPFTKETDGYRITPPYERRDIVIPEDVVEEVGRIIGYDKIAPVVFTSEEKVVDQARYRGIERIKDALIASGYTEISTPSFASSGEVLLSNPLDETRPYLRPDLSGNIAEAVARAKTLAPRVLPPPSISKLFEVGTVFKRESERFSLAFSPAAPEIVAAVTELCGAAPNVESDVAELRLDTLPLSELGTGYVPSVPSLASYQPFSSYPFALRDVAVWTPESTEEKIVRSVIEREAGALLVRLDLFDRFLKDGRVSYAFRLVLEADDRTLTETELNDLMERVTRALNREEGFAVR